MSVPVIILGAGGHAKVVLECLRLRGVEVIGLVDVDPEKATSTILGQPVLGGEDVVDQHPSDTVELVNAIGSTNNTDRRKTAYQRFHNKGYTFASVVHTSAVIGSDVELSDGVQVMAGAVIQPGAKIGANSIINTGATVDHDSVIGQSVHVAPGVTISGNVTIGDGCHVGAGSTIIHGVEIGENCLVGAGAVVTRHFASAQTILGVPAMERNQ